MPDARAQIGTPGPRLTWLGTADGNGSIARDVSAFGHIVVGDYYQIEGGILQKIHQFRWTESDELQLLGTLGGEASRAENVSADGQIVMGTAQNQFGKYHAFRWTAAEGMQPLGT